MIEFFLAEAFIKTMTHHNKEWKEKGSLLNAWNQSLMGNTLQYYFHA